MPSSPDKDDLQVTWEQVELAALEGDHRKVILLLKRLDRYGVWRATARIGELYETGGIDVDKDIDEAIRWYRKAVFDSDDPLAHLGLGRIYFEGSNSIPQDLSKARIHLMKAYDCGLAQAGIYLGIMNLFGMTIDRDLLEAERFFRAAAVGGFPLAYRYLANIYGSSGKVFRTIDALVRGLLLTVKLKMQDRNHPNLWKIPNDERV